jgi:hypothetical protein
VPVTSVTIPPRGPGGEPLTLDLSYVRAQCEGLIQDGAETRAEQSLAAIVVALVDRITEMNRAVEGLL